jgi:GT2 family glycosyltransferase
MEDRSGYQVGSGQASAGDSPREVVILVHYGDPGVTLDCLKSIAAQEGQTYSVVIVDHGPGDPLAKVLADSGLTLSIRVLRQENLGFGPGCNLGASTAFGEGADWVWFLNPDARLESPVLSRLLDYARQAPEVGLWGTQQRDGNRLVGSDTLPRWFPTPRCAAPSRPMLPAACKQLEARETLSGASILVSRAAWERIGPMPDWCFLYWEDTAWCLKAHETGIPLVMTDLEITHRRNTTTGRHSALNTYYGVRNGLLLHRDQWPENQAQRTRQAFHLLQKRFFQGHWGMLGPTLRGIRDARKGIRFRVL